VSTQHEETKDSQMPESSVLKTLRPLMMMKMMKMKKTLGQMRGK